MPWREIQVPWDAQPQEAAYPDLGVLASLGIVAGIAYTPSQGDQPRDLITGDLPANTAATRLTPRVSEQGVTLNLTDAGTTHFVTLRTGSPSSRAFSFATRIRLNTQPAAPGVVWRTTISSGTTIPLWRQSSQWDMRIAGTDYTQAGAWNLGQWYDVQIIGTATSCIMYVDGNVVINGGAAALATIESTLCVSDSTGGAWNTGENAFDIAHILWAGRPWTEAERRFVQLTLWQLFAPRTQRIWIPGASSLPTLSALSPINITAATALQRFSRAA